MTPEGLADLESLPEKLRLQIQALVQEEVTKQFGSRIDGLVHRAQAVAGIFAVCVVLLGGLMFWVRSDVEHLRFQLENGTTSGDKTRALICDLRPEDEPYPEVCLTPQVQRFMNDTGP